MAQGIVFSKFTVGESFESGGRTVSESEVSRFAGLSGDFNPLHTDAEFAKKTPFKQRVAHGMLCASISTGQAQTLGIFGGTTLALLNQTFTYKAPVFFGDTIRIRLTVTGKKESSKGGKGVVTFQSDILNQDDVVTTTGEWKVLMRDG